MVITGQKPIVKQQYNLEVRKELAKKYLDRANESGVNAVKREAYLRIHRIFKAKLTLRQAIHKLQIEEGANRQIAMDNDLPGQPVETFEELFTVAAIFEAAARFIGVTYREEVSDVKPG